MTLNLMFPLPLWMANQQTGAAVVDFSKVKSFSVQAGTATTALNPCNCIGPQDGQPRCPCQMRSVIERDGRYIQPEVDLGPVIASRSRALGDKP